MLVLSLVAVVLAAINMAGGFVVTDRMLQMFRAAGASSSDRRRGAGAVTPVWAQLGYLAAAVCFILALKGLSSPRTARRGNLIGAAGAVLATRDRLHLAGDLDHLVADLLALGRRHGDRGARRLPGADDPDAPAGGPVQRRGRRRPRPSSPWSS